MATAHKPATGDLRAARRSTSEIRTRRDLAACYRLVHHHGWTDLIYNHITARLPDAPGQYLVNPYGMLYDEITGANLIKVDLATGEILEDDPAARINVAAHDLHAPILASRPDLHCVAHVHTPAIMAVSAMAGGLLPLTQTALGFYKRVGFHEYGFGGDACERLARDFATVDTVILRNHGVMIGGRTIAEAYVQLHNFQMACEAQVLALAAGSDAVGPAQHIADAHSANYDHWLDRPGGPRDPEGCVEWDAALRILQRKGVNFED